MYAQTCLWTALAWLGTFADCLWGKEWCCVPENISWNLNPVEMILEVRQRAESNQSNLTVLQEARWWCWGCLVGCISQFFSPFFSEIMGWSIIMIRYWLFGSFQYWQIFLIYEQYIIGRIKLKTKSTKFCLTLYVLTTNISLTEAKEKYIFRINTFTIWASKEHNKLP